jgi:hypothetical protein
MSAVRRLILCGLIALPVSACANLSKPYRDGVRADGGLASRGSVDDPRLKHFACLRQHHLQASELTAGGFPEIQVGQPGVGPLVTFLATPGGAQYEQIDGLAQGAEVIGAALLYPGRGSDAELQVVEACTALGVKG